LFKIICFNFCHTNATGAGETEEKERKEKPLVFIKDSLIKLLIFDYEDSQGYTSRRFSSSTDYSDKCGVLKD
jgi:hypothetical protein